MTEKTIKFKAAGMSCTGCEKIIEKQALKIDGVKKIKIDYATQKGKVTFDDKKINIDEILDRIEEKGYQCCIVEPNSKNNKYAKIFGWSAGILGIIVLGYFFLQFSDTVQVPTISQNMSYVLLFVVGLLTGLHCVAMCGGFVISYTTKNAKEGKKSHKSHLMYGLGKTVSYTLIGAAFGLLGSIVAFTPEIRGIAGIIAGIFLLVFGLSMLNIIPGLRKLRFKTPKFLARFIGKNSERGPLIIGLLNGLMLACGPLQAIYIMAAGTGSIVEGARLLFIFALGTLPVMLSFGYLTSYISSKATMKLLKLSGIIVIILGIFMINNGLALAGTGYDVKSIFASSDKTVTNIKGMPTFENGYQVIRMDVTSSGWDPDKFILKKGVPVKWIINGKEITSCNSAIQVPKYGLKFDIKPGEQTIEFTPTEEGVVPWSCWMGMIQGTFIVKSDLSDLSSIQEELNTVKAPATNSETCEMSAGSCGCGR